MNDTTRKQNDREDNTINTTVAIQHDYENSLIKDTVGVITSIWAVSALFSTYIFSTLDFINKSHIPASSAGAIFIYIMLISSLPILIATMGKSVCEYYSGRIDSEETLEEAADNKTKNTFLEKFFFGLIFLATVCACLTYGTFVGTAMSTFQGSSTQFLSIFTSIVASIGLCLSLIPFLAIPAFNFLKNYFIKKTVEPNKTKFLTSLIGELFLAPILAYYATQKFDTLLIHNKTISTIVAWICVVLTVLLIATAIQDKAAEKVKVHDKQSQENKSASSANDTKLKLNDSEPPKQKTWTEKSIKFATVIFWLGWTGITGLIGGSSATYIGVIDENIPVPEWLHIIWALLPIAYWITLYGKGPGTIYNFFMEGTWKQYLAPTLLGILTAGGLACAGIGISMAIMGNLPSTSVLLTISYGAVIAGSIVATISAYYPGTADENITNRDKIKEETSQTIVFQQANNSITTTAG